MTEKTNSTISIVLLVIGLILGGGGGYFFGNSSYQPQIDELDNQILGLKGEIDSTTVEIQSLEDEIVDVEEDIEGVIDEIEETETELAEVLLEYDEILIQASEVSTLRDGLEEKVTPNVGHYKFSMFGLSFDYPKDMELEVVNLVGEAAESSMGTALATRNNGEHDVAVTWISMPYYDEVLDVYWNETIPLLEEMYDTEILEITATTISGNHAKTIKMTGTFEGDFQWSIMAAFYSHADNKLYVVQYNDQSDPELSGYIDFFNSIRVEG